MPSFEYYVKDKTGNDIKGNDDAPDASELVRKLKAQGYMVIRIEEVKKTQSLFSVSKASTAAPVKKQAPGKSGGIKIDDMVVFARQMATLVAAGIPLVQSLEILSNQVEKEQFRVILRKMFTEVQTGKSLSESMMPYQKVFSSLFIHMVKAGETSGRLEEILDRVALYLEKASALQKKVKSAMMYPAVVSILAFGITFAMLAFVIPKFATIFDGLGAKLPAPTQFLINVSNYLAANWWWILALIGGGVFLFGQIVRLPAGRLVWDAFQLRMPVFGPIILKVAISKFSRTLATLIKSGVAILAALEIVSKTSGNAKIEQMIVQLMGAVNRGESLSGPLEKGDVFPPMVVRMIAIGEETGELEEMLTKIADFYDTQVDTAVSGLTSLIEPLIIAFLGIVIGGIVMALFLPILTLTQAMG
ncbi:MAG: Type II secretion system protein F [Candidatus Omnitrophica bacterium ADurb.Bin277]|nr:MAG: Type II secretion system protein F [Candidatus Omnitrophica bacterium ADurb.Bin277]